MSKPRKRRLAVQDQNKGQDDEVCTCGEYSHYDWVVGGCINCGKPISRPSNKQDIDEKVKHPNYRDVETVASGSTQYIAQGNREIEIIKNLIEELEWCNADFKMLRKAIKWMGGASDE